MAFSPAAEDDDAGATDAEIDAGGRRVLGLGRRAGLMAVGMADGGVRLVRQTERVDERMSEGSDRGRGDGGGGDDSGCGGGGDSWEGGGVEGGTLAGGGRRGSRLASSQQPELVGEVVASCQSSDTPVTALCFSPDGQHLISLNLNPRTLHTKHFTINTQP